ncbi:F-box only protein 42 isoform X1 [Lates japonicus]|uniref:F-box only protein 42 isoform X1 n=1 Tax=Lates japonicus TaxID=270547 RepID=A0AAD3MJ22_LATJO|nr:F-box only protein 42 isoform X1 [Lates japonicus]
MVVFGILKAIKFLIRSNEVWVLDLEQWSWSKPPYLLLPHPARRPVTSPEPAFLISISRSRPGPLVLSWELWEAPCVNECDGETLGHRRWQRQARDGSPSSSTAISLTRLWLGVSPFCLSPLGCPALLACATSTVPRTPRRRCPRCLTMRHGSFSWRAAVEGGGPPVTPPSSSSSPTGRLELTVLSTYCSVSAIHPPQSLSIRKASAYQSQLQTNNAVSCWMCPGPNLCGVCPGEFTGQDSHIAAGATETSLHTVVQGRESSSFGSLMDKNRM